MTRPQKARLWGQGHSRFMRVPGPPGRVKVESVPRRNTLLILLFSLVFQACSRPAPTSRFPLEGQALAVRPGVGEVVIKHGNVPGLMPAMVMPFRVRDAADSQPGDSGRLRHRDAGRIRNRLVAGAAGGHGTACSSADGVSLPHVVDPPLVPGGEVPAVALEDQDGERFSPADLKGPSVGADVRLHTMSAADVLSCHRSTVRGRPAAACGGSWTCGRPARLGDNRSGLRSAGDPARPCGATRRGHAPLAVRDRRQRRGWIDSVSGSGSWSCVAMERPTSSSTRCGRQSSIPRGAWRACSKATSGRLTALVAAMRTAAR